MKKLLIVTDQSLDFGKCLTELVSPSQSQRFDAGTCVPHDKAMETFLSWKPTYILIMECESETLGSEKFRGNATYRALKPLAGDAVIIRTGFFDSNEVNFVRMPFRLEELWEKFGVVDQ